MEVTQGAMMQIGMLVIFIGIIILLISPMFASEGKGGTVKFSFVGLLGPIPFGFANDKKLFVFSIFLAIALMILAFFMFYTKIK
jgi:uncharacterized protein (TIGR00304 family)